MANELQIKSSLSVGEVKAGLDLILQVMKVTMEKGRDYGVIPGCKLPSLWKPGAEKILTAFRIGVDPEIEDLSGPDCARFRVKARLFHEPTGMEIGKGIGEASSDEDKFRWRKPVCDEEFDEAQEDRRRIVWKHGKEGKTYQAKQVRMNPADMSNTVLKMAKKRAQIDGTLTATAASALFTQDLEDLEKEVLEAIVEGESKAQITPPIKGPEIKPTLAESEETPANEKNNTATFVPVVVSSKPDKNGKTRWSIKSPSDMWFSTYHKTAGAILEKAKTTKQAVAIEYKTDGEWHNITSATLALEGGNDVPTS